MASLACYFGLGPVGMASFSLLITIYYGGYSTRPLYGALVHIMMYSCLVGTQIYNL
ncbi:hypothetical protein BDV34DRAFT_185153 [Aspergillus parasiticus]|uniref:Uncharacterized protein n=1 Tax=Aspergillus parasiticus TaxID=5067 RepID=A0A5N6E306_ASPPA|nr:hypothetical protein BDV34DRAFT_185153 [Aspergillus parasiticus]